MFEYFKKYIWNTWLVFRSSVAFYPSLISVLFLVSALLLIYAERQLLHIETHSLFIIKDANTARTILSTIIGSIISLAVFSFSMVMLLLNQAANNYSPRVLPGLITDRRHQLVLGFFIGTVVYCLVLIVHVIPEAKAFNIPGLSVFFSMILTLFCIGLFVYFLHNISQSIQVTDILNQVYNKTLKGVEAEIIQFEEATTINETNREWFPLKSLETGYFQNINLPALEKIVKEENCSIFITLCTPCFAITGNSIAYVSKRISKELQYRISSNFLFSNDLLVENNFVYGFKQISEIITKAMSPGINDPGTALNGIHYLTNLFSKASFLKTGLLKIEVTKEQHIFIKKISFDDLLYETLVCIRQYAKHDVMVVSALILMFERLFTTPLLRKTQRKTLLKELLVLEQDIQGAITNTSDLKRLHKKIQATKQLVFPTNVRLK